MNGSFHVFSSLIIKKQKLNCRNCWVSKKIERATSGVSSISGLTERTICPVHWQPNASMVGVNADRQNLRLSVDNTVYYLTSMPKFGFI